MRKFFLQNILALLLVLNVGLGLSAAASFAPTNILDQVRQGVGEQSTELEAGSEELVLPIFQEDPTEKDAAVKAILATVQRVLDLLKLVLAPVAVLLSIAMAIRMVGAGTEYSDDVSTKFKNYIRYAIEGLIIVFAADAAINAFFGPEGEVLRGGEAGAKEYGRRVSVFIEGIYGLVQVIIGTASVLVLVSAGMRYVAGGSSDDQVKTAKRQITWALAGLILIGLSQFIVYRILFPDQGSALGVGAAKELMAQITNFISGLLGTLSFVFLIYAGYLYVVARDNDDGPKKAKQIMYGAFVGLIIAAAAFALSNTLVELDSAR